jgi:hypothetical protein
MKPTKTLFALAFLLVPAAASAQGYGGGPGYYNAPPPSSQHPGGFHNRDGRLIFGFSLGLGGMSENGDDVDCPSCDYSPIAGQISGHLGGFVGPRFALMGELQANVQTIGTDGYDTEALVQTALMLAGQYWLTPQLWIKGGIGFSNLRVDNSYYGTVAEVPENGLALMGAIGFELLSARNFSVDLQGRLINGSYDSVNTNVSAGSIGIGLNWF